MRSVLLPGDALSEKKEWMNELLPTKDKVVHAVKFGCFLQIKEVQQQQYQKAIIMKQKMKLAATMSKNVAVFFFLYFLFFNFYLIFS